MSGLCLTSGGFGRRRWGRKVRLRRGWLVGATVSAIAGLITWGAFGSHGPDKAEAASSGIHKIKHVVVIMQENRSFDSYFGTYPGAEGIPMKNGKPKVCVPDPLLHKCFYSYHDVRDINAEAPHAASSAEIDIAGGAMNGFIASAEASKQLSRRACPLGVTDPECVNSPRQVMGYHNRHELPLYWHYADNYVLQDHMFEPTLGWSLPSHLFMVSGWSATCATPNNAISCHSDSDLGKTDPLAKHDYAWTDLTYLMRKHGVSWRYYIEKGTQPDCDLGDGTACPATAQSATTPGAWN